MQIKSVLKFIPVVVYCLLIPIITYSQTKEARPFVLGMVENLYSAELGENRILNIYLPAGYNENDTMKYAVTYLLDGSSDEDFIHIAGLYQFNTFEWVNRVPATIVVGIATVDRRRDFTFPTSLEEDKKNYPTTGHSAQFISFIEKELQPFIDNNYRTTQSKTLIGQSLGGLLATEILLKKPALFDNYIIVSPSLWWDNGSLLNVNSSLLSADYTHPTNIYLAAGKEGLSPGQIPRNMIADVNLLEEKLSTAKNKYLHVYFDYLPNEDHATILHQAVYNAMKIMH